MISNPYLAFISESHTSYEISGEFRLVKYFFLLIFSEALQCYHRLQFLFYCLSGCVHVHIYMCVYIYLCNVYFCKFVYTKPPVCDAIHFSSEIIKHNGHKDSNIL